MKYVLAIIMCAGVCLIYALIGAGLGWEHGGGVLPMSILFAALCGIWRKTTKSKTSGNATDTVITESKVKTSSETDSTATTCQTDMTENSTEAKQQSVVAEQIGPAAACGKEVIRQRILHSEERAKWVALAFLLTVFIGIIIVGFSDNPCTTWADTGKPRCSNLDDLGAVSVNLRRDLSTPSSRLVGHWRNEQGTTDLYYIITDYSLKIGYFIIHNKRGRPGAPIRFKILSEELSGDRLIVRQFQDFRRLELVLGYRITQSAVTHCIPKHGQSMTQEQTSMGDPILSVYRYVDDKTRP